MSGCLYRAGCTYTDVLKECFLQALRLGLGSGTLPGREGKRLTIVNCDIEFPCEEADASIQFSSVRVTETSL